MDVKSSLLAALFYFCWFYSALLVLQLTVRNWLLGLFSIKIILNADSGFIRVKYGICRFPKQQKVKLLDKYSVKI